MYEIEIVVLVWSVDLHWLLQRTYLGAVHDGIPLVFWEPWNSLGHSVVFGGRQEDMVQLPRQDSAPPSPRYI